MAQPFVSCIMPTANRPQFLTYAIDYFLKQDYTESELIILDDGAEPSHSFIPDDPRIKYFYKDYIQLLGTKRNFCCEQAIGEIIVHLDDDDWYATDWISKQVEALTLSGADLTGLSDINFFINASNQSWEFRDDANSVPWVYGGTFAYYKTFWALNRFAEMNSGEDNAFIFRSKAKIQSHNYTGGYLGLIHRDNAGIIPFENPRYKPQVEKWVKEYKNPQTCELHKIDQNKLGNLLVSFIMPTSDRSRFVPMAINNFLQQDYNNKELIIIDDGKVPVKDLVPDDPRIHYFYFEPTNLTIGAKRNLACERANGPLMMHWDDDDWYAADWTSFQVQAFLTSGADICGLNQVQYYSPLLNKCWLVKNSDTQYPWLSGQTLLYKKQFWEAHLFKDQQTESDDIFVSTKEAKTYAHDYYQGLLATIHGHNTTYKFFEDKRIKNYS